MPPPLRCPLRTLVLPRLVRILARIAPLASALLMRVARLLHTALLPRLVRKLARIAEFASSLLMRVAQLLRLLRTNDRSMLSWAGHGVAMGNAPATMRAEADEVAATNDDDGVAAVLERIVENGRIRMPAAAAASVVAEAEEAVAAAASEPSSSDGGGIVAAAGLPPAQSSRSRL